MSHHRFGTLPGHYLKPGEMYLAVEPTVISTLLGSCVSVTMFHPGRRIGAICHGLLPECRESGSCHCVKGCGNGFKNMSCSIRLMLERFRALGIPPGELEVKVFGGSDMFEVGESEGGRPTVGRQNMAITLRLLAEAGIKLKARDLGGERGRKIYFYSHTGEVLLKRLRKSAIDQTGESA